MEHDRLLHGVSKKLLNLIPLAVGSKDAVLPLSISSFFLNDKWNLEIASMIYVEIVMTREVGMKDKLLHQVCGGIKEYVHPQGEVVEEVVIAFGRDLLVRRRRVDLHLVL